MAIPFKLLGRKFAVPPLTVDDFPGAVDVFVYDTTKDSDGGAWTNGALAQASSWYNETLNTAARGARRDFPKVAVIVAESNKVTIYDGEDPALPMWMVFQGDAANGLSMMAERPFGTYIAALNGELAAACPQFDAYRIRFVADDGFQYGTISGKYKGNISQRNDLLGYNTGIGLPPLVSRNCNDVAMTVLPGAPTDPTTGLKVPTVLVGTDGGLSIIKDNGTVVDVVHTGALIVSEVGWRESDNAICYAADAVNPARMRVVRHNVPASDLSLLAPWFAGQSDELYPMFPNAGYTGTSFPLSPSSSMASRGWIGEADAGSSQLTLFAPKAADPTNGMRAVVTSTYNTGWMHGDTVGAFLCNTSTAALVGGTDNDRSPYNTPLTVNGTITRTAVATGAELVGYSGFSASNYLEQPYNSNLDFGTGDFCVMGWVKTTGMYGTFIDRRGGDGTQGLFFGNTFLTGGTTVFVVLVGGYITLSDDIPQLVDNNWNHVAIVRQGDNIVCYFNGDMFDTLTGYATKSATSTNSSPTRFGVRPDGQQNLAGSLALWRISATAPDADQIAKIYRNELKLFQPDAACTLAGTSSDVRAVDYDRSTGRVLALASDGWLSSFRGLVRRDQQSTGRSVAMSSRRNKVIVT